MSPYLVATTFEGSGRTDLRAAGSAEEAERIAIGRRFEGGTVAITKVTWRPIHAHVPGWASMTEGEVIGDFDRRMRSWPQVREEIIRDIDWS